MEIIKLDGLCNNFLIKQQKQAVLVDCSCSTEEVKEKLGDCSLVAVILTHGHFDHFWNIERILNEFEVKVYLDKNAFNKFTNPVYNASANFDELKIQHVKESQCVFVEENKKYELIPGLNFEFFVAYGHTNDSILTKVENNVFVGDFVFENGYGRTDLPTGSFQDFKNYYKKHLNMLKNNKLFYGH